MGYKYDLFISYASEDQDFVRPLAEVLRAKRIAIWYDEFELRPGMGLRESIDRGLVSSRLGLVVLSPAFFAKSWPRWELDGLVQLAHSRSDSSILPVWHHVDNADVAHFSPSLANIIAIKSSEDPEGTAAAILGALRLQPTAVEVARERLIEFGFPAPVLSDDWWLDAAVWSASTFGEGTFQESSSWGWWGFPLPPQGDTAQAKGERIAWAAMQHSWKEAAIAERITQCTHPSRVVEFISRQPGLAATAETELDFLLFYAPQLGLRGLGGFLELDIDSVFTKSEEKIKANPERSATGWVIRDLSLCGLGSDDLVWAYFWPTDPAGTSPDASVLVWVDAAAWIASTASDWLPGNLKACLRDGLASKHAVNRMNNGSPELWDIPVGPRWSEVMHRGVYKLPRNRFVQAAREVFEERLAGSRDFLDLPEPPDLLLESIASWGVFESYWAKSQPRSPRKKSKTRQ